MQWDQRKVFGDTKKRRFCDGATKFNGDVSDWDVSNVIDMRKMFKGASRFNDDVSSWDVSSVTNMDGMFNRASEFRQNLCSWKVEVYENMFEGSLCSVEECINNACVE